MELRQCECWLERGVVEIMADFKASTYRYADMTE
jgi:hypothetical protein